MARRPPQANEPADALSPAAIRQWVEQSCAKQGVPVHIADPTTLRNAAVLLRDAEGVPLGRDAKSSSTHPDQPGRSEGVNVALIAVR